MYSLAELQAQLGAFRAKLAEATEHTNRAVELLDEARKTIVSAHDAAEPWLPQPVSWGERTAASQEGDPDSMLELYRTALRLRRELPALGEGPLRWHETPEGVLMFSRTPGFACAVNLSATPYDLPAHTDVLLASGPLDEGALPKDTAVWLAVGE